MRVLTTRELNRTYLHRQMLSERAPRRAADVIAHLVALQGQEPDSPYLSLWSRTADFHLDELTSLLDDGTAVRSALLRGTQHLCTGEDYLWLRPTLQPALDRVAGRAGGLNGVDPAEFEKTARAIIAEGLLTRPEIARRLVAHYPGLNTQQLTWNVHLRLSLLHPPPSGTWRHRGRVRCALAEEWLGRPMAAPSLEKLVMRYLAAYGPASVKDIQVWSGITRLSGLMAGLRDRLRVFRDEAGIDLYDLPDAPLLDDDGPVPVVFLPEFDNAVLGHADRARIIRADDRRFVMPGWSIVRPTVLVDGFVSAIWSVHGSTLRIAPFRPLSAAGRAAVEAEGVRLMEFAAPEAARALEIRWEDPAGSAAEEPWAWRPRT